MKKPEWNKEAPTFDGADQFMGNIDFALEAMKKILREKKAQLKLAQVKANGSKRTN